MRFVKVDVVLVHRDPNVGEPRRDCVNDFSHQRIAVGPFLDRRAFRVAREVGDEFVEFPTLCSVGEHRNRSLSAFEPGGRVHD